jgi:hypothetical protein
LQDLRKFDHMIDAGLAAVAAIGDNHRIGRIDQELRGFRDRAGVRRPVERVNVKNVGRVVSLRHKLRRAFGQSAGAA